jgi:hypothetical protein
LLVLRGQHGRECGGGRSFSDGEHRPSTQSRVAVAAAAKTFRGTEPEIRADRFGAPFTGHFAPRFFFQQPF